jgi:hypothetical protein
MYPVSDSRSCARRCRRYHAAVNRGRAGGDRTRRALGGVMLVTGDAILKELRPARLSPAG